MGARRGGFLQRGVSSIRELLHSPLDYFILLFIAGCASPGEPYERKPPTPQAVNDLAVTQVGQRRGAVIYAAE